MKFLAVILAALPFLATAQIPAASAQEIQTYRPAPRGLDVIPKTPLILRNNSPYRDSLRDCSSGNCYKGRANRPTGNNGPTQAEKCRAAYQSYRAFDNTYKPFNRPRERCNL
jgi:hypothetical protein